MARRTAFLIELGDLVLQTVQASVPYGRAGGASHKQTDKSGGSSIILHLQTSLWLMPAAAGVEQVVLT